MSARRSLLRRRRSEIEDEGDADVVRSSQRSTPSTPDSSKRARTNGHDSDTPSESPEPEEPSVHGRQRYRTVNGFTQNDDTNVSDGNNEGPSKFQAGAIVRVKVVNFVTYTKAEFFPGPNLNMIIGPNGTGKSSLVCAICLGLGWSPKVLGRASQISEFVKHGMPWATVETELMRRDNESENHVVRLKIIRDQNGREWFLNGKKTSLQVIQTLTRSLSIQIDNLCQFLPQDKVSEFAALSPVELLHSTQRAAAPEHMLKWHDELKKGRQEQKLYQEQIDRDKESLQNHESRQEGLQAEVERLKQRNQIQEKVALLKKAVHVVDYNTARKEHKEEKMKNKVAKRELARLEAQVEPTIQTIRHKHEYAKQITRVISERTQTLKETEKAADNLVVKIEALDGQIVEIGQKGAAERKNEARRRESLQKMMKDLEKLEEKQQHAPPEFNGPEWNEKIRAKEHEGRDIEKEIEELTTQDTESKRRGKMLRDESESLKKDLDARTSQEGQQITRIENLSMDTANAWKWIQENQGEFEEEVYGPPLITCSVKDSRYAAAVECSVGKHDVLAITAQTPNDFKKLSERLLGDKQGLADVTLRSSYQPLAAAIRPRMSIQELQRLGLDGWALDYVDGPEPVLAMLCGSANLDRTAVSLKEINDEQYSMIANSSCRSWIAGKYSYAIKKRMEYGPQATSTTTRTIKSPQFWTDSLVDTSAAGRAMEARIEELDQQFGALKKQILPARRRLEDLKIKLKEVEHEVIDLKSAKGAEQKAYGEHKTLPQQIIRLKSSIVQKEEEKIEILKQMQQFRTQHDHACMRKAKKVLEHKEQIELIRICHQQLLDAEVRLIEAESDAEALTERNKGTVEKVQQERENASEAERKHKAAYAKAQRLAEVCAEIVDDSNRDFFKDLDPELTVEDLEARIRAEESQLEFIHASNPNAIRDFEKRQLDIDKLKEKVHEAEENLERINRRITKIRGKWEPELDKLVAEISDAFSYNFEQIGCAGEVGIHKDDDFDQWSIQIKVKFRENETLQILDQHRQSGGERSVSTIFYLMSLQSLARAPFRVVDEINQGMDPRNERMVHERMVEIACKEHTSQYFLITPKLLTNLRYDKRMKVHCIASGEYMPADHRKMDVRKVLAIRRAMVAAA